MQDGSQFDRSKVKWDQPDAEDLEDGCVQEEVLLIESCFFFLCVSHVSVFEFLPSFICDVMTGKDTVE